MNFLQKILYTFLKYENINNISKPIRYNAPKEILYKFENKFNNTKISVNIH